MSHSQKHAYVSLSGKGA
ncbi:hypothetical protein AZE42_09736 [Rhizopogon vesiculosus]|uniref:Uncharacterized protein n=1 Tax=Rhizopogon vesiculosus TaxID=180088 RepID=A0A1J8PN38_9AGAM|nr:hypothetical protein AZE42_09736 [Rhizopogon vesiculosus]